MYYNLDKLVICVKIWLRVHYNKKLKKIFKIKTFLLVKFEKKTSLSLESFHKIINAPKNITQSICSKIFLLKEKSIKILLFIVSSKEGFTHIPRTEFCWRPNYAEVPSFGVVEKMLKYWIGDFPNILTNMSLTPWQEFEILFSFNQNSHWGAKFLGPKLSKSGAM